MTQALDAFFRDYADSYNQALTDHPDFERIRRFFTKDFLAAGPEGVTAGKNDETFSKALKDGYDFYRAIGTKKMTARRVEATPIDDAHVMAKVFYSADYQRKDGSPATIDFDVAYLLQTQGGEMKIFAFIAGDEMGLYRQYGLVGDNGKPA